MKDYLYREPCDDFPIAMAYVPWQRFNGICENLEKGYCDGTVFPELDKLLQEGDVVTDEYTIYR